MKCPKCFETIKYKERSHNKCPKCSGSFAFEPKYHPLQLTDIYFSKVVDKLSDNGKLYFTPQQLQFAVSRKKIKSNSKVLWLLIPAIITTIITFVVSANILKDLYNDDPFGRGLAASITVFVFLLWIVIMICLKIFRKTHISLPQHPQEFKDSVIHPWKSVYGNVLQKLLSEKPKSAANNYNLRGILFCETKDTRDFLFANQLNIKFGLSVHTRLDSKIPDNLPIYVLHDASSEGIVFLEKIKERFANQRQIIDLGLRPNSVINSKLTKFRQTNSTKNNFSSLTKVENDWLNKGYYTPLFVLKPEKLIQYVTKQIEQRSRKIAVDNPEKEAQAIGFMTWVGEK